MERAPINNSTYDTRAFFIIDALSEGCLIWARKALLHLGATLALAVKKPPPVGIAILQRKGPKQSNQLQARKLPLERQP